MPFLTRLHGIAGPGRKVWTLYRPMLYRDPDTGIVYLCPRNQVSDLASIPRLARWLIPGNGRERQPAVLHDEPYGNGGRISIVANPDVLPRVPDGYDPWQDAADDDPAELTDVEARIYHAIAAGAVLTRKIHMGRFETDALFNQAMRCAQVNPIGREMMYRAVQVGGWVAWQRNAGGRGQDLDPWNYGP